MCMCYRTASGGTDGLGRRLDPRRESGPVRTLGWTPRGHPWADFDDIDGPASYRPIDRKRTDCPCCEVTSSRGRRYRRYIPARLRRKHVGPEGELCEFRLAPRRPLLPSQARGTGVHARGGGRPSGRTGTVALAARGLASRMTPAAPSRSPKPGAPGPPSILIFETCVGTSELLIAKLGSPCPDLEPARR